ncbi:MAG: NAD(P)/FAD-dependent oxidoreductase [Chloroflexi bacterium]|nr:NAD(P)/FAD-dependent oxidoreductase [Chloroflexota bacterium]
MDKYHYVIVGGGMTADAAVDGIREIDQENNILLISSDIFPPYNRPPLSKGLWKGKELSSIWRNTGEKKAELKLDTSVIKIDPEKKTIETSLDEVIGYDKLLLATGGTPRKLPFGGESVIYYHNFADYQKLHALSEEKTKFSVIGSGFIGSEIAAALAMQGLEVSIFDIGPGIGWNIYPDHMVNYLNEYYREKGVKIFPGEKIEGINETPSGYQIHLENGELHDTEVIVAGIGIQPNVKLAEQLDLKITNGIEVDNLLQTTQKDILAAGDVANFFNPLLNKRIRVEHEDNANAMGKQAGRNMAGAGEAYDHLSFFYSDLFDLGYEAVGELDSRSQIIEDWQEKYQKGVLYYLKDGRVTGVLLWNVWDQVDAARELIGMAGSIELSELKGRIK